MRKANTPTQANLLMICAGVLALSALVTSIYTLIRFHHFDAAHTAQSTSDHITDARLRFCHDEQIIPCDDASIDEWNKQHPDNRFNR